MFAGPGAGIVVSGLLVERDGGLALARGDRVAALRRASPSCSARSCGARSSAGATWQPTPATAGDRGPRRSRSPRGRRAAEIALARARLRPRRLRLHHHRDLPAGDRTRGACRARAALDFFWPIFGLGVVVGALLSTRLRVTGDLRTLLAGAYLIQAAAIALGIWFPTPRRLRARQLPARRSVHRDHVLRDAGGPAAAAARHGQHDRPADRHLRHRPDHRPAAGRRAAAPRRQRARRLLARPRPRRRPDCCSAPRSTKALRRGADDGASMHGR